MQFQGKAAYRGPVRSRRCAAARLPRRHRAAAQPDSHRAVRPGAVQSLVRRPRTGEDRTAWFAPPPGWSGTCVPNGFGVPVWMHHFDWPYRQLLRAPWYSGLAQGNGLSLLVRAAKATGDSGFCRGAHRPSSRLRLDVAEGGVLVTDDRGASGSRNISSIRQATFSTASSGRSGASTTTRDGAARQQRRSSSSACVSTLDSDAAGVSTPVGGRSTSCRPAAVRCWRAGTTTSCTSCSFGSCSG